MATINLQKYAPAVTQQSKAEEIYRSIMAENPQDNHVTIDLTDIITMTTQCARIIFGELYKVLTSEVYYRNIKLLHKSEELGVIIDMGIRHAMQKK